MMKNISPLVSGISGLIGGKLKTAVVAAMFAVAIPTVSNILGVSEVRADQISADNPVKSSGEIYRVVDGDTYVINLDNPGAFQKVLDMARGMDRRMRNLNKSHQSIKMRLASVNTPESVHPDSSKNTEAGRQISASMKRVLEKKNVDVFCYDFGHYGRLVCNVEVIDPQRGRFDVGGYLIRNGYSDYITDFGRNPVNHELYISAAREARQNR